MSPAPMDLQPGDPCPQCGGTFTPARRLSPAEWLRLFDKENPQAVPPRTDTLHPDQVRALGALHLCTSCSYKTRFPVEDRARVDGRGRRVPADARGGFDDAERFESQTQSQLDASRKRIAELEAERARSQGSSSS
jgi:hypothetical protein